MNSYIKLEGFGDLIFESWVENDICWEGEFDLRNKFRNKSILEVKVLNLNPHILFHSPINLEGYCKNTDKKVYFDNLINVRGKFNSKGKRFYFFSAKTLTIGNNEQINKLEFFIPDILIGYTESSKVENRNVLNISKLNLEIDGNKYDFILEGNPSFIGEKYDKFESKVSFTLKVTVKCGNNELKYGKVLKIMEVFFTLLSYIYGSKKNWIMVKGYIDNKLTWKGIRDVVYSNFEHPFSVMPVHKGKNIINFIKKSFNLFYDMKEKRKRAFYYLFDGLWTATENLVFPVPFIVLASTLEVFMTHFLDIKKNSFLTKKQKNEIYPEFEKWIKDNIIEDIEEEERKDYIISLKQRLSHLVGRNFKYRLNQLFKTQNLLYDREWIRSFVNRRNDATHNEYKYEKEDSQTFFRLVALVQRFILSYFSYNEEYYDWSTFPPKLENNVPKTT